MNAESDKNRLGEAIDCVSKLLLKGLQHGYFQYEIRSTVGKHNRRELLIQAGEIHKFIVPLDDLPK